MHKTRSNKFFHSSNPESFIEHLQGVKHIYVKILENFHENVDNYLKNLDVLESGHLS